MFSVKDKLIVVTGGLGQLGKQFTNALLENGAKVAVLDIELEQSGLPEEWEGYAEKGRLIALSANITSRTSLEEAMSEIYKSWGAVPDGLVNNAALDSPPNASTYETGPLETFPEASWDRVMEVNVKGVFLTCQVFGGAMAKAGHGSIINIGSTYGLVSPDHRIYEYKKMEMSGQPFFKPVVYSVSKSALINLTRYLAVYWAKSGVRTNLIALGGVFNNQDSQFLEGYCEKVPMGRMAKEDEYNGAVIFLLSDASSYMTGSTMTLDGGWTAW